MSQTVISLRKLKFSKQVRAFTEHGALMATNILDSPRAVVMSVYVIRAFVKMREDLVANAARKSSAETKRKWHIARNAGGAPGVEPLKPRSTDTPRKPACALKSRMDMGMCVSR